MLPLPGDSSEGTTDMRTPGHSVWVSSVLPQGTTLALVPEEHNAG